MVDVLLIAPRTPATLRLVHLKWIKRVPDAVLFPAGVVLPSGVTSENRPVRQYLRAYTALLVCSAFLPYAALGEWSQAMGPRFSIFLGVLGSLLFVRDFIRFSAIFPFVQEFEKASAVLRTSAAPGATSAEALYQQAFDLVAKGHHEKAVLLLQNCLELDPNYILAHKELAHVLRKSSDTEGALTHRRKVRELDPSDKVNRYNLANLLRELRRTDQALLEAEDLLKMEPGNAKFQELVTIIKQQRGA